MKLHRSLLFLLLSISSVQNTFSQNNIAEGYFTSEAKLASTNSSVIVSIKKFNPSQLDIDNARKPDRTKPMNYLMLPFEATNISMFDKGFESKLYALDTAGNLTWDLNIGYSESSTASPVKIFNNFIYTGEASKEDNKVVVQKIDLNGKVIWKTILDSLQNVNDIYVDEKRVSALLSFNASKKIENSKGQFSEVNYPIYFFVQFDVNTGKIIVKEYQKMANYLSSINFSNPFLNSDYSYYLHNKDSAAFMTVMKLENATIVSENMSKENSILSLTADEASNHLLTAFKEGKNKYRYQLISDFYVKKQQYETSIPIEFNDMNRSFIFKNTGDSIVSVIGGYKNISIAYTNVIGKTTLYKKIDKVLSPIIGVTTSANKVYILQIEGRNKPGSMGKLKLFYY